MHPATLISSALRDGEPVRFGDGLGEFVRSGTDDYPAPEPGVCCVTGEEGPTVPRRLLLGPGFTDGALLEAPESQRVSVDVFRAFSFREVRMGLDARGQPKAKGFAPERMSSWICDGQAFRCLDRRGVRAAVFAEAPAGLWCGYATTSYKKHGSVRAKVNGPGRRIWLFELRQVDCSDTAHVLDMWGRLNAALRQGFFRSVLESVDCPPWLMAKVGIEAWREFEAWAKPLRNSALYDFLCYLLPSQEEMKGGFP